MGKVKRLYKNWPIHNIVGHPAMEILTWFKMHSLARKIHDGTLPPEQENE